MAKQYSMSQLCIKPKTLYPDPLTKLPKKMRWAPSTSKWLMGQAWIAVGKLWTLSHTLEDLTHFPLESLQQNLATMLVLKGFDQGKYTFAPLLTMYSVDSLEVKYSSKIVDELWQITMVSPRLAPRYVNYYCIIFVWLYHTVFIYFNVFCNNPT